MLKIFKLTFLLIFIIAPFSTNIYSDESEELKQITKLFNKLVEYNKKKDWKSLYNVISKSVEEKSSINGDLIKSLFEETDNDKTTESTDSKNIVGLDNLIYNQIDKEIKLIRVQINLQKSLAALYEDDEEFQKEYAELESAIEKLTKLKDLNGYNLFTNFMNRLSNPQIHIVAFNGMTEKYEITEKYFENDICTLIIKTGDEKEIAATKEFNLDGEENTIKINPPQEIILIKEDNRWKLKKIVFSKGAL